MLKLPGASLFKRFGVIRKIGDVAVVFLAAPRSLTALEHRVIRDCSLTSAFVLNSLPASLVFEMISSNFFSGISATSCQRSASHRVAPALLTALCRAEPCSATSEVGLSFRLPGWRSSIASSSPAFFIGGQVCPPASAPFL